MFNRQRGEGERAASWAPIFQLAMSSYQDELTLSVNLYGSASDRARIISFLKDIDA